MAALVVADVNRLGIGGSTIYTALVTLTATETTAGTVDTLLSKVLNAQLTWATSIGTTTSTLFYSASGGVITVDATDALDPLLATDGCRVGMGAYLSRPIGQ